MRIWRRRHIDPLACREFVELVTDYLEGRLPNAERARFETHLAECDGCAGYLEDTRRMIATLGAMPAPEPDAPTREALLRAFRELRGPPA
jgi:anti-sigma factor RsiW